MSKQPEPGHTMLIMAKVIGVITGIIILIGLGLL